MLNHTEGGGSSGSTTSDDAGAPSDSGSSTGGSPLPDTGQTGQPIVDDVVDTAQGAGSDPVGTVNDVVDGTGLLPDKGPSVPDLPVQVPEVGNGSGLGIGK